VRGAVQVTGNTAVDAVLVKNAELPPCEHASGSLRLLVTCHRRESWDGGLQSIASALREIGETGMAGIQFVLHPNPRVALAMRQLLKKCPAIELLAPLDHVGMLAAMRSADLLLSDSGGMQEEAATLGIPLLVLRERTERPEAIATGNIELVGTGSRRIVDAVQRLLVNPCSLTAMRSPSAIYGDGMAAERIAGAIADWLARRSFAAAANENGAPPGGEAPLPVPAVPDQKS
jgi:UDP-N-acetylglucosamine 2-epimerase (non-hydrolysing)